MTHIPPKWKWNLERDAERDHVQWLKQTLGPVFPQIPLKDIAFHLIHCPRSGWHRPQLNMDGWSSSQNDCLSTPQIPYWHLPSDCAYSKLRGLKKTKMVFLLEPYLAAVLFSFSLTDTYMLTKAKQNEENRNRRTLHIYLEPSGFSTPRSSQVSAALGQFADATPPFPSRLHS